MIYEEYKTLLELSLHEIETPTDSGIQREIIVWMKEKLKDFMNDLSFKFKLNLSVKFKLSLEIFI